MSEIDEVLEALERHPHSSALVTIIGVRGSTYRREGARLLVPADGEPVGNISGGCLEAEVTETAREVIASGEPRVVTYDLTADDDVVWGWGLGCNGVVEVLVEPAERAASFAETLRTAREEERPLVMVTRVDGERAGSRLVVRPDGSTEGDLGGLQDAAREAALDALRGGRSRTMELPGGARVFVEVVEPAPRLVICGAGHDAIPLCELGARMGFAVVVVDDRPAFLSEERFPEAREVVRAEPSEAAGAVEPDERTHVVVMSHNYLRDRDYLRSFLPTPAAYLGMLGPRARLERLLAEVRRDGLDVTEEELAKVHGPAGLDLGAEGPDEIAWAILAEILAVRRGHHGGFLRDRAGPIHEPKRQGVS